MLLVHFVGGKLQQVGIVLVKYTRKLFGKVDNKKQVSSSAMHFKVVWKGFTGYMLYLGVFWFFNVSNMVGVYFNCYNMHSIFGM